MTENDHPGNEDQAVSTDMPAPSDVSEPTDVLEPVDQTQVNAQGEGDATVDDGDTSEPDGDLKDESDDAVDEGDDEADEDAAGAKASRPKRKGSPETLESQAEIAADYLEELLDIADLDGDIDTYIEGDRAHVSIVSENDLLVGDKGSVLDALQELARLAVMTETGERSRLMLDVAGFRDKRRSELVILATDAVAEVQSSKERLPLAPMNPFERKIVHDTVAAAGLTSASEGEEPRRHVVVLPVG